MKLTLLLSTILATAPLASAQECASSKCQKPKAQAVTVSWHADQDIIDTAVAAGSFETLAAAVKAAGLIDTLKGDGPFTVFAPTDEAFAKLPEGTLETLLKPENKGLLKSILTYHVVSGKVPAEKAMKLTRGETVNGQSIDLRVEGGKLQVDGAQVIKADIQCTNGVIHVIDTVILPATSDIVATATEAGSFQTLAAALKAAQLVETLKSEGPFTVFAPTDDAFGKLPKGTVESLLKPENRGQLTAILKYHVVSGRVFASEAVEAGTFPTLQGGTAQVRVRDGRLYVNGAAIVKTDLETTNGVIHVIDTVLLPVSDS
ncbi:MAG: fasciclin domain-containing protein [Planctomycetota bacterium]